MKKYVITCVACLTGMLNVQAQKIAFEKSTVDAGATLWKRPVTATFRFTNKEKTPLRVTDVDAGCGCLKPEWPQKAVQKGGWGEHPLSELQAGNCGKIQRTC